MSRWGLSPRRSLAVSLLTDCLITVSSLVASHVHRVQYTINGREKMGRREVRRVNKVERILSVF